MSDDNVESRPLRLDAHEWLFLAVTILFWGAYVLWLGKDTSWDFRNYHWYIPYAFLNGRGYVTPQDVKSIGPDVLRHRIIVSYEAEPESVTSETVIDRIFAGLPVP